MGDVDADVDREEVEIEERVDGELEIVLQLITNEDNDGEIVGDEDVHDSSLMSVTPLCSTWQVPIVG